MRLRSICLILLYTFSLMACMRAQKVDPVTPSAEVDAPLASATFSMSRASLADLGTTAQQLVIHVYKVEAGILGDELREPYKFQLTDAGLYVLEGLPLGEIEFQVALLDAGNQSLADGTLRAVINPGAQTLPKLSLKPKKPTTVDVDVSVAINLLNFPDVPVEIPAEPEAVRNVLKTYRCQNCHSTRGMMGGYDLQSYPYKNKDNESFLTIFARVVDALTAANGISQMPPSGATAKPDEVALMSDQLKAVTAALTAGNKKWVQEVRFSLAVDGTGPLESVLVLKDGSYALSDRVNLTAGSRYAYTLTVYGPGGSKLHEVLDGVLEVPLDGKIALKLDISYQAPTVTLPVVVE